MDLGNAEGSLYTAGGSSNALNDLGIKILMNARNELFVSMRFLSGALMNMDFKNGQKIRLMGTDGRYLYYNTMNLTRKFREEPIAINRLYLHEMLHCVFGHPYGRGKRSKEFWTLACNITCEYIIDNLGEDCVRQPISKKREELYAEIKARIKMPSAENIYRLLFANEVKEADSDMRDMLGLDYTGGKAVVSQVPQQNYMTYAREFNIDDHAYFEGAGDDVMKEREIDREKWMHIRELMQTDLETLSKNDNGKTGVLEKLLSAGGSREKVAYDNFIANFTNFRETMHVDPDSFDTALYSLGLRAHNNMPIMEPLEYNDERVIRNVLFVLDVSENMTRAKQESLIKLTFGALKGSNYFTKNSRMHIIQAGEKEVFSDSIVKNQEELNEYLKNFKTYAGSGKDTRPTFEYIQNELIKRKREHVSGLLYFTDGVGIYSTKVQKYKVAYVFYDEDGGSGGNIPAYAIKYIFDEDQYERL